NNKMAAAVGLLLIINNCFRNHSVGVELGITLFMNFLDTSESVTISKGKLIVCFSKVVIPLSNSNLLNASALSTGIFCADFLTYAFESLAFIISLFLLIFICKINPFSSSDSKNSYTK